VNKAISWKQYCQWWSWQQHRK